MPKTSIIINSQDTLGKSTQRSFTDVNPKAQNSDLATFGQRLTAMTSNVHGGTIRIDKTDCDNDIKPQRSLRLYFKSDSQQISSSNPVVNATFSDFTKTGNYWKFIFNVRPQPADADELTTQIAVFTSFTSESSELSAFTQGVSWGSSITNPAMGSLWSITVYVTALVATTLVGHLHLPESDTYAAYDKDITFNITDNTEG